MQHERLPEASDLVRTKPRLNLPGESEELAKFMDQMPDINNINNNPPLKTEVLQPVKQLKEKMMDERTGESVDKQEKIEKDNLSHVNNDNNIFDNNVQQWLPEAPQFNIPPPGEPSEIPPYDPQHPNLPSLRSKVSVKVQAKVHHEKLPPPRPTMEENQGPPMADRQAWDQIPNAFIEQGGFDTPSPPQGFQSTNRFAPRHPESEGNFDSPSPPQRDRFDPPSAQEEEMIRHPVPPTPHRRHHHRDKAIEKPSSAKHHKSHHRHKSQNVVKANPSTSKTINIHITAPHADRARRRRRRKKNKNVNTFVMEEPQYARVEVEPSYPPVPQQEEGDFYHKPANDHGNMFISPDTDGPNWAVASPKDVVEPTIIYSKERGSDDTEGPDFPVPFRPPRDPLREGGSQRGLNFGGGDNVS